MRLFLLAVTCAFALPAQASNNVLLIIADDFGVDACRLYNTASGAQLAPMPNLDNLAASGVKFTNAYACPLCSPTRSAVLTGRHGSRTGTANVVGGSTSNNSLKAAEFTLPEAFAVNSGLNYQLKQIGKWHLGGATTAPCLIGGWPSFAGAMVGEVADFYSWTKVTGSGATASSTTSTTYATTDNVNDALSFINTQVAAGKPWFTWLAFNAPHIPYHKPPTALCPTYAALSGTPADITANPRNYFNASIEAMDTEIGRLLAGVDLSKTTVIFIGDNGTDPKVLQTPYVANRGKATLYEGGIRVPMIIRGPDVVSPGRTSAELTHVLDLYSTILELAGINLATTIPAAITLDSKSLLPVIKNLAGSRTLVFDDYFDLDVTLPGLSAAGRSLRDIQYKLIRLKTGTELLYNLAADPYEGINLMATGFAAMSSVHQAAYTSLDTQLGNYNTSPTISNVSNQYVAQATATNLLPVTIGDAELSTAILLLAAKSSNTVLVPMANLVIGGSGASRTVRATPAAGLTGTTTITLSVTDGIFTTSSNFVLSVGSPVAPILQALGSSTAGSTSTLSWAAVAGAESYTLQISSSADFAAGLLSSQTVSTLTANFSSLTHGLTYYYRVRSNNSVGSSSYSNAVFSTQDTSLRPISLNLVFSSPVGTTYTLQYSPDMTIGSWTDIGSVTSIGSSANFTETNGNRLAQPKGFYRAITPTVP